MSTHRRRLCRTLEEVRVNHKPTLTLSCLSYYCIICSCNPKATCIHRVSRAGLEQMIAKACKPQHQHQQPIPRDKAVVQCPVSGCKGLWTAAGSVLDEEMIARMEMHGRSQAMLTQQQLRSYQADVVDLDD